MQTETTAPAVDTTAAAQAGQATTTQQTTTSPQASGTDGGATGQGQANTGTEAPANGNGTEQGTQQDQTGNASTEQDRDEKGQFKSKIQKRIDELTHAKHSAEREAARWRAIAEGHQTSAAPQAHQFATDAEYEVALRRYDAQEAARQAVADQARAAADQYSQDAEGALNATYEERAREATARIPDFVDVVSKADIPITPEMQNALKQSPFGPDIVYQLAKDPEQAAYLASLPPAQMYMAIGQMQGQFASKGAPAQAAVSAPAARTTNAPPPAATGTQGAAPPNTDPSTMSMAEFKAWSRANGSKYV